MRFHVLGLPHTQTTRIPSTCAYTQKVRKFCNMMYDLGHTVYLYAGEENEARVTEHITVVTQLEQVDISKEFDPTLPHWLNMNRNTIEAMKPRVEDGDYICVIAGRCQEEITNAFPNTTAVEYGIGYDGVYAPFKVFESYAWMHSVYGGLSGGASKADGAFYDTVIPNYFEVEDFPEGSGGDYLLFVGRLIDRKGLSIVNEVAERIDIPLYVAGEGSDYVSDKCVKLGVLDPSERAEWMGGAKALIAPTLYLEPFGGVTIEAMMCGTPVITTDWGAFTETVNDKVGVRCRTLRQFLSAVDVVDQLDRTYIRQYAIDNYSTEVIAKKYHSYFQELETLKHDGWYTV